MTFPVRSAQPCFATSLSFRSGTCNQLSAPIRCPLRTKITHDNRNGALSMCAPVPRGARARRLCLPTTRELKYLSNIRVRRSDGRAAFFTRTTSFSLLVWPLVIYDQNNKPKVSRATLADLSSEHMEEGFVSADVNIEGREDSDQSEDDHLRVDTSSNKLEDEVERPEGTSTSPPGFDHMSHSPSSKLSPPPPKYPQASHFPDTVPPWAYVFSLRASKAALGKRAVQRNRAKRRIRAAAAQILPLFAVRGMEYCFTLNPEILVIEHSALIADVHAALKATNCWSDYLTEDMVRREKYCER